MILSRAAIQGVMFSGALWIDPLGPEAIRAASVDLRLGPEILRYNQNFQPDSLVYDPKQNMYPSMQLKTIPEDGYLLQPGEWILGATLERVTLPESLEGILSGKSSWARLGLSIEDAGYIDPAWDGNLTLEIKNNGPLYIKLYPGEYICQIRFSRIYSPGGYQKYGDLEGSHYQGSTGPVSSLMGSYKIGDVGIDAYGRSLPKEAP